MQLSLGRVLSPSNDLKTKYAQVVRNLFPTARPQLGPEEGAALVERAANEDAALGSLDRIARELYRHENRPQKNVLLVAN